MRASRSEVQKDHSDCPEENGWEHKWRQEGELEANFRGSLKRLVSVMAHQSDSELTRHWCTESSRIGDLSDMGLMKIQRTRQFRVMIKTH